MSSHWGDANAYTQHTFIFRRPNHYPYYASRSVTIRDYQWLKLPLSNKPWPGRCSSHCKGDYKYDLGLSCKPNIYVSWSTSELRVRLAPLNRFKPSSKIFYWPFQGGTSFVDLLCFCSVLCLLFFVRVCLYVLCGHLLGKGWPLGSRLWCLLWVCHFPIGILGQVWYLIVSIPDLCTLITLEMPQSQTIGQPIAPLRRREEEPHNTNSHMTARTQLK